MALLDEPGGSVSTVEAGLQQARKRRKSEGRARLDTDRRDTQRGEEVSGYREEEQGKRRQRIK